MLAQSTQKPTAWRIERFNKQSGKREFDETEYDAEPSPDFLANMGRSWRVVVTKLHAGPVAANLDPIIKLVKELRVYAEAMHASDDDEVEACAEYCLCVVSELESAIKAAQGAA